MISGLDWVLNRVRSTGRPSVVSMSISGNAAQAVDDAIASLTNAGIHVVVAAGNRGVDAALTSPARAPSAITVAASEIGDNTAYYSNYGRFIDIWAPGTGVISASNRSDTVSLRSRSLQPLFSQVTMKQVGEIRSGTSMATPHVAGAIAYLIAKDGNITPAQMATKLNNLAVSGILSGVRESTIFISSGIALLTLTAPSCSVWHGQ
jgi:cerevisin